MSADRRSDGSRSTRVRSDSLAEAAPDAGALPVAPGLAPSLGEAGFVEVREPRDYDPVDRRPIFISSLAILIGIGAARAPQVLTHLIGFVTNLVFYGRIAFSFVPPGGGHRQPLA